MKWTDDQRRIIDLRKENILVSAAAGSGKTAVLVERIIDMVRGGANIDSFLIVTFTNAAASGMRQKIQKALVKAASSGDGDITHLRKQLNLLNRAQISTIHSFCIDVVRKNFHIIGIDPGFRIADPNESDIILQEAVDEVLEEAYASKELDFIRLVESFTKGRGDRELAELIKDMYHFTLSFPEPDRWLDEAAAALDTDQNTICASPWMEAVKDHLDMLLSGAYSAVARALGLCSEVDGPAVYSAALSEDLDNVTRLSGMLSGDFDSFMHSVYSLSHPKLASLRGKAKEGVSESIQAEVKTLRDEYKKIIENIKKSVPNRTIEEFAADVRYMQPPMKSLCSLVTKLRLVFRDKKLFKALADFGDVEHYALKILSDEDIAKAYKDRFKYIFIDEYQDSNRLQETLISRIKGDNNLFMVGDVKQSIYRFRQADPGLFIEKYSRYSRAEGANGEGVRIDLMRNFRSRREILDGTNLIFKSIMSQRLGEIDYSEDNYLNNGTKFPSDEKTAIELCIIDKNDEDENVDEEIKAMKTAETEARYAVKLVNELVGTPTYVPDTSAYRPIAYNDIVILLRAVSDWGEIYEEVFADEGIPFYSETGAGYFETVEIQVMLNLLRIIDNIRQDIPLLSVMRSPIGGFTTEELTVIRLFSPRLCYIEAVYAYKNKGKDSLSDKLRQFIEKVEGWKKKSRYIHLNNLIWDILVETGYYYFAGALPKGSLRQANLRLLADKAGDFEKTSMRGLFNFLRYVEKLHISSSDMSPAKTLGENDNVVRLMTVHKSKGLEFPVVIMGGLGKKFNKRDMAQSILRHKDYGLAPKYVNPDERVYRETFPRLAVKNVVRVENISEEMRVLYVAMTRAIDRLILVGTVRNASSSAQVWKKGSTPYSIYSADSFLDWICTSIYRHRDCSLLRELNGDERQAVLTEDLSSRWKISMIKVKDAVTFEEKRPASRADDGQTQENMSWNAAEIDRRLSWQYGYRESVNIPTKLSVTDIKAMREESIDAVKYKVPALREIPSFKEIKSEFTRAEIGTIVHFIMQHLNLSGPLTPAGIREQAELMVMNNLLTEEELAAADTGMISRFFDSSIGKRMKQSPNVRREIPFVIGRPASAILDDIYTDDEVLIQGIIDCCFMEGDEAVIIDYKTDDVSLSSVETLKDRYSVQILAYRDALAEITQKKVKACYLYLFDADLAIEIK